MEKVELRTADIAVENAAKLAELFPDIVTEVLDEDGSVRHSIDVEALKAHVGDVAEDKRERYQFTWPGKQKARAEAIRPIDKTMRPCPEESVNWDTTENLYIEGDNLDALKILRETYAGKIKMIYIDPPYNTGHDFIYKDSRRQSQADMDALSSIRDDEGNLMDQNYVLNSESKGTFHSDWCSMMYTRILLARDLMLDGGLLFASIDECEYVNLKKVLDELFGETAYVTTFVWHNNAKGRQMDAYIKGTYEFILVYTKQPEALEIESVKIATDTSGMMADHISPFEKGYPLHNGTAEFHINNRPNLAYSIYYNPSNQDACCIDEKRECSDGLEISPNPSREGADLLSRGYVRIIPKYNSTYNNQRVWRWGAEKFLREYQDELLFLEEDSGWYAYQKKRYFDGVSEQKPKNYIAMDGGSSKRELARLLGAKVFQNSKPVKLIKELLSLLELDNDVVLDFFSGSATTAHAVMQLNAEDGGDRKFIMVQLPEVCDEKSEAAKAGYKNICEIGKERIRRAGAKIASEVEESNAQLKLGEEPKRVPDIGFRVLKIDSSNFEDVRRTPDTLSQDALFSLADNVKPGRTPEDILFQLFPKLEIPYTARIDTFDICGKTVYSVDDDTLVACFDLEVPEDVVRAMAEREPAWAVLRDASFMCDDALANFEEIFKTVSPETKTRVV